MCGRGYSWRSACRFSMQAGFLELIEHNDKGLMDITTEANFIVIYQFINFAMALKSIGLVTRTILYQE